MQVLTVVQEFAAYKVGDSISDPQVIEEISKGHNASKVVRANVPDQKPA